jgi:hypothetical protein
MRYGTVTRICGSANKARPTAFTEPATRDVEKTTEHQEAAERERKWQRLTCSAKEMEGVVSPARPWCQPVVAHGQI